MEGKPEVAAQVDTLLAASSVPFSIDIAYDLSDAVQALSKNAYNVALVDVAMKTRHGGSALAALQSAYRWLPIVAVTDGEDDTVPQGASASVHAIVDKSSLSEETLLKAIQAAVRQQQNLRDKKPPSGDNIQRVVHQVRDDLRRIEDAVTLLEECNIGKEAQTAINEIRLHTKSIAGQMENAESI